MRDQLNKKTVMVEITEPPSLIYTIRKKKFFRGKVLQVGSEVDCIQPGDEVVCYNEGKEIADGSRKIRILAELGVMLKFN